MKQKFCFVILASLASVLGRAQGTGPVTITSDDMFNQVGLYHRAYSNPFDPNSLTPTYFQANGVQGSAGTNQVWDFSDGPTNVVYRFDYVAPTNVDASIATNFPQATIVEQQRDEATGDLSYLFFQEVPEGRKVYGFYQDNPLTDPLGVFTNPILDFPSQIKFKDTWTTTAIWQTSVSFGLGSDPTDPTDPGGGTGSSQLQITQTSAFTVDAYGTIVLPGDLGFGPGLRINAAVTQDTSYYDDLVGWQDLETDYTRNFYWLMPGRGIVASLASAPANPAVAPPPDNFDQATQFWRLFETNKKPGAPSTNTCVNPDPVTDIQIKVSNGQVLLKWAKAACATQYQVEYSTNPSDTNSWKQLSPVTSQLLALDTTTSDQVRFYRIISMK